MSSRITIKTSPTVAFGGLISIIVGVLMIVGGGIAWGMVSQQLANERIYVSEDAPFLTGKLVNEPFSAYAQAEAINKHALDASGGKTYAELDQNDPVRATVMNAAFLRSSLFTSVVSFGVSALAIGAGIVFAVVGWSLRRGSVGPAVVVETDNAGPVEIVSTRPDRNGKADSDEGNDLGVSSLGVTRSEASGDSQNPHAGQTPQTQFFGAANLVPDRFAPEGGKDGAPRGEAVPVPKDPEDSPEVAASSANPAVPGVTSPGSSVVASSAETDTFSAVNVVSEADQRTGSAQPANGQPPVRKPVTGSFRTVRPAVGNVPPSSPRPATGSFPVVQRPYTGATPAVSAASASEAGTRTSIPSAGTSTDESETRLSRSSRSALSAHSPHEASVSPAIAHSPGTGTIPTVPSFDDLIAPENSASISRVSRSERILTENRRRVETERSRTGLTGTIPIVGETRRSRSNGSAVSPAGGSALSAHSGKSPQDAEPQSDTSASEPRPVTGAIQWQSPEDRLK